MSCFFPFRLWAIFSFCLFPGGLFGVSLFLLVLGGGVRVLFRMVVFSSEGV